MSNSKIVNFKWGQIHLVVEGIDHQYKDAMLYPTGVKSWDWKVSDTHHNPGIGMKDVEFLLDNGAEVIVLSRGVNLVLQIQPDVIEQLTTRGIPFHTLQSEEAVAKYNELVDAGAKVGALIHSTC